MERIPKVIHYAWFGGNNLGNNEKKCIESWKKILPDYKLIEWNENNFDLEKYDYAKKAYENKKYAYVSDVVRLHVLYEYGGIYMDTDVEAIKPFGALLEHNGFSGFESDEHIPTGTIASEKGNEWVKEQLEYYNDAVFSLEEINEKHITNVDIITNISLKKHGLLLNNEIQELKYGMMMYPSDYFCAKSPSSGIETVSDNTYTIHHFAGSWVPKKARLHKKIFQAMVKIMGEKKAEKIISLVK